MLYPVKREESFFDPSPWSFKSPCFINERTSNANESLYVSNVNKKKKIPVAIEFSLTGWTRFDFQQENKGRDTIDDAVYNLAVVATDTGNQDNLVGHEHDERVTASIHSEANHHHRSSLSTIRDRADGSDGGDWQPSDASLPGPRPEGTHTMDKGRLWSGRREESHWIRALRDDRQRRGRLVENRENISFGLDPNLPTISNLIRSLIRTTRYTRKVSFDR